MHLVRDSERPGVGGLGMGLGGEIYIGFLASLFALLTRIRKYNYKMVLLSLI